VNSIDYLIISSSIDYSTDIICYRLKEAGKNYFRLNRDELSKHKIEISLEECTMTIEIEGKSYFISNKDLKSIYFRAPVFQRYSGKKTYNLMEQLEVNQWNSFIRNLIIFDNARWINNPVNTYQAENKLLQLKYAQQCGLNIPKTIVSNHFSNNISYEQEYIVKSIDTALFYDQNIKKEMFTYATIIKGNELQNYDLHLAPIFIQELITQKIDYRVTVIGNTLFPIKIKHHGAGVEGDWRKIKFDLEYETFTLPEDVCDKLLKLMKMLRLEFAGIDLAISNDTIYFIELNPTGEWGWLEQNTSTGISQEIIRHMEKDANDIK
jgi:glutathione synthase/RimK-type ligase-like ATP-grasp enzyme